MEHSSIYIAKYYLSGIHVDHAKINIDDDAWVSVSGKNIKSINSSTRIRSKDNAEFETCMNYTEPTKGEGYVMITRFGYFKLVDRSAFSYANFSNPKFAAVA